MRQHLSRDTYVLTTNVSQQGNFRPFLPAPNHQFPNTSRQPPISPPREKLRCRRCIMPHPHPKSTKRPDLYTIREKSCMQPGESRSNTRSAP